MISPINVNAKLHLLLCMANAKTTICCVFLEKNTFQQEKVSKNACPLALDAFFLLTSSFMCVILHAHTGH